MNFKAWEGHIVKYGVQEDGIVWGKEKLMAVTPDLRGKVVMLPDGTLALVFKMEWDSIGLRVTAIPKDQVIEAIKNVKNPIIIP